MNPHRLARFFFLFLILLTFEPVSAQKQKVPPGGRMAIIVDERLSALRATPELNGKLVRRLGRGRLVAVRTSRISQSGVVFYLVNISSRTQGWIQREAVVAPSRVGDDQRLLNLITGTSDFDRIVRARIFLDYFPRSALRPEVLLLLGDAAEQMSERLTKDAARRVPVQSDAPEFSFYLNHSGLDRYNRQGVMFIFDEKSRRLRYDGAAWREILRRYPRSEQTIEAQTRLAALRSLTR